jgi:hypothetical protein
MAAPFVVAPPGGTRVRTRLHLSLVDEHVLRAVGTYLGSLARRDLARRCREGHLDPKARATSRRERKRSLTAGCSSRWAGTITRCSEDGWRLGWRNLTSDAKGLRSRINRIPVLNRRIAWGDGSVRSKADRGLTRLRSRPCEGCPCSEVSASVHAFGTGLT